MLELGRLTQDLVRLFEPGGRWLFVKLVVLIFTLTALGRLIPRRPRRSAKRMKRGAVALRVVGVGAAVAGIVAASLVAVRADHEATVYAAQQATAFKNRPAHASLTATLSSYIGVYEPGVPYTYTPVQQFAAATRSKPRVVLYYSPWNLPFVMGFALTAYSHGAITMVQLMPSKVSLQTIADGGSDKFLRAYAQAVRTFRHPIIIGFAPEMNGNWYTWGYLNSPPSLWVAAWRHLVNVFRANGAYNVCWLWTVNMIYTGSGPLRDYWPGSSYVTWVGIDAYFVPQKHAFNDVVGPTLSQVRQITSDPVILSETGIAPAAGKAATLRQLFTGVRADGLLGFVYFDGNQPQGANYHYAWRLEDSPAAMTAYSQLAGANQQPVPAGSVTSAAAGAG